MIVAIGFGLVMGWGLGRALPDPRPAAVAYLVGMAAGAIVRIGGLGATPGFTGGSLLLGCTAALAAGMPSLIRHGT